MQDNSTRSMQVRPDSTKLIIAAVNLLASGQVTELRVLDAIVGSDRWPAVYSGYFNDPNKLAQEVARIKQARGIYFIPNPVKRELLARRVNRLDKAGKGELTTDDQIEGRRWLLIDIDVVRPSGISSTDAEHATALDRAQSICTYLTGFGWPAPIIADSGNGAHLLYRINLPVDDDGLVRRCLEALSQKFDDATVAIDRTVHNPARIWKLYGTYARKGDDTPERPHRMAKILSSGEPQEVPIEFLDALATTAQPKQPAFPQTANGNANGQSFDVESFIVRHNLDVTGPKQWNGKQGAGRCWEFRTSPVCSHHDGAAFLLQHANGAISAKCLHNSCAWDWDDLRESLEPQQQGEKQKPAPISKQRRVVAPIRQLRFPLEALPKEVAEYVNASANAIGCDPAYIALPLLGCLARAIGNRRTIRLKSTWDEPAIIWGAIIGKSGTHKTPALQAATSILQRKQGEAIAKHKLTLLQYEQDKAVYERDHAAWKRKKGNEPPPQEPAMPACERYITTDATVEALADRLSTQFDGVYVVRDELAGWLGGIAEYKGGKGSDLGHWLAAWSGAPLTIDRKTGAKFIHIPRAAVGLAGGIQPSVLRGAMAREHMQDGLCARLLLVMPAPRPVQWSEAVVDPRAEGALEEIFDRLLALEPAVDEEGNHTPVAVQLSREAKAVWIPYFNRHRAELAELSDELAAAWSKLEAYTARFALIFALCRGRESIDQASMEAAISLSDWFGVEARRVYALFAEDDEARVQRELIELIQRRGGRITARELVRSGRQYQPTDVAEAALNSLSDAGYGEWQVIPTATNHRRDFVLSATSPVDTFGKFDGENENPSTVDTVDEGGAQSVDGWEEGEL